MSEACRDCFIRSDRRWPAGLIGILPWYGVDRHSKFSEQEACDLCLRPLACGDVVEGTTKLFLSWTLWSRFMMIFDHFCFRWACAARRIAMHTSFRLSAPARRLSKRLRMSCTSAVGRGTTECAPHRCHHYSRAARQTVSNTVLQKCKRLQATRLPPMIKRRRRSPQSYRCAWDAAESVDTCCSSS